MQLLGSGSILQQALRAQELLADKFGIASDVWSVTSYKELRREALEVERWNLLHPDQQAKTSYLLESLGKTTDPIIAVSDNMRLVPEQIAKWFPERFCALGTDGFGRSESREALRKHFEIDAEHVAFAALSTLHRQGRLDIQVVQQAVKTLNIDTEQPDPVQA